MMELHSPATRVEAISSAPEISFRLGTKLEEIERIAILETLKQQGFNRTRAAIVLGIGIRTLQRKLKKYSTLQAI